ncbi:MAG: cohesin domain-containing protein [Candidatus Poribacteria bacterium]|nr:cohesin domain-containing protein [Candidatus Poribacteria bacterium]
MKKHYFLILLSLFLGLHLSAIDILAQSCTQLSLPENATARLCRQDGDVTIDLDYSPDGKTLASLINWRRQIVLWDIENRAIKLTIDANGRTVRYSPDGKTFVCGDVVYDAITGEPKLLLLDGEEYRRYVVYSPDGKTIAGAGPKGIRFWKSNTEEPPTDALPVGDTPIDVLPTDTSAINTPGDSPTSIPFATSSTTVPGISGLSYSPDGKEIAIACNLGIWIYDPELNKEVALLTEEIGGHKSPVVEVVYSPDGNTLAAAGTYSGDNTIRLWDATTKKLKFTFKGPKIHTGWFYGLRSLAFSSDSKMLISTDGKGSDQIHIWDTVKGEYKWTLHGHRGGAQSAIFSPDSKMIATAGDDQTIILWDLTSYPIVSISPDSVTSSTIGEELAFDVKITNGKDISGYQATIEFDPDALAYVETKYGDFLSGGTPVQPIANQHAGTVQLASLSLSGDVSNGNGTLATVKFKVKAIRTSKLGLRDVILSNPEGNKSYAWIEGAQLLKTVITEDGESIICSTNISEDVNKDCVVNIQDLVLVATNFGKGGGIASDVNSDGRVDIIDLVLVAGAFGDTAGAPTVYEDVQEMLSSFNVQQWLHEARKVNLPDSTFQRGILMLEQLLMTTLPKETALLPNYPNPFNPETWIPYQLAEPTSVNVSIYSAGGTLVRTLGLGNQAAGLYQSRSRAAYWDGKNSVGESVASGIYFYTLTTEEFSATRKMLILK